METKNEYEFKHLRICRHGLQRESCRKCLFEVLCHLEEQKAKYLSSNKNNDGLQRKEEEIKEKGVQ